MDKLFFCQTCGHYERFSEDHRFTEGDRCPSCESTDTVIFDHFDGKHTWSRDNSILCVNTEYECPTCHSTFHDSEVHWEQVDGQRVCGCPQCSCEFYTV